MAINQNHLFEELDGVKCAIVEKNVPPARVGFLRRVLEYNRFTVVVVASPPPKVAPAAAAKPAAATPTAAPVAAPAAASAASPSAVPEAPPQPVPPPPPPPPAPETFTVGVTDVAFNAINAIFGRLLKTSDGHIVTLAYWQQKDTESRDDTPYFEA
ncbi:hypothetical protein [Puia sp.]|jgi:hypothetical protein|uniref:hypothetical protein n=1 Tax=Puia sp. TaxID=2045100 RepID=UPI002F41FF2D